jgi:phytoene synthase
VSYAAALRSSEIRGLADDARKDDESVGFLAELPLSQQAEWLARLRWLRIADRLAENELVETEGGRFRAFCGEWRAFTREGIACGEHAEIWREMRSAWWSASGEVREPFSVSSYDDYLAALRDYTRPGLVISSLADHDRMLLRLTGSLFGVFPYLQGSQRTAAAGFGMLDQMMNNVRDMAEDTSHGLCYFPRDVLARFGVEVASLLDGSAVGTSGYASVMRYWLDEHAVLVRGRAAPFIAMGGLHPSLAAMRRAFLSRYARIERVFRSCSFDYLAFPGEYWRGSASLERAS